METLRYPHVRKLLLIIQRLVENITTRLQNEGDFQWMRTP